MSLKRSWKSVLDSRGKGSFVGRGSCLEQFEANLIRSPQYLVFFVSGEGGVGKTKLLEQFGGIVRRDEVGGTAVVCDDFQPSPALAMGYIADSLAELGVKHKEFGERLQAFRARKAAIESDPKAPRGAVSLVVKGMTDLTIKGIRRAPGVGVFAEYVDEKAAGDALAQGFEYLLQRKCKTEELELLREPERIMTPLFVGLLNLACEKRPVVLMFDVYERTREALEPWLLKLLCCDYGDLDTRLTFVISGRDPPEQAWTRLGASACYLTLEPFSEAETRQYLALREIVDDQLCTQIHADTGGLPVLVELLAATKPQPGSALPDISKDAVKRFLQWVPEPERQQVALLAAIPRSFTLDTLSAALGRSATPDFAWLSAQSYIKSSSARGWFYHDKVRDLMLRYLDNTCPAELVASHAALAAHFDEQRDAMQLRDEDAYANPAWRHLELEAFYHRLSQQEEAGIATATNRFVHAFGWRCTFAAELARTWTQVASEKRSEELMSAGDAARELCRAYDKDEYSRMVEKANWFLQRVDLDPEATAVLKAHRGYAEGELGELDLARSDLNAALSLVPGYAWAFAERGWIHAKMGKPEEELADAKSMVQLDDQNPRAHHACATAYAHQGMHEERLAELNRALELDSANQRLMIDRADAYEHLGKLPEALVDLNSAIGLGGDIALALAYRGSVYQKMGNDEQAVADWTGAIELDGNCEWAIIHLAGHHLDAGQFDLALAGFDRLIALNQHDAFAHILRGKALQGLGKNSEALGAFHAAGTLSPGDAWVLAWCAVAHQAVGNRAEAMEDIDRALELDPKHHWALEVKGGLLLAMSRFDEALDVLNRALASCDDCAGSLAARGYAYLGLGQPALALVDFDRAVSLRDSLLPARAGRAQLLFNKRRYGEAITDLDAVLSGEPGNQGALELRIRARMRLGRNTEALQDCDSLIATAPDDPHAYCVRATVHVNMGNPVLALADCTRAVEQKPDDGRLLVHRADAYIRLGRTDDAVSDLRRAVELEPENGTWLASLANYCRRLGRNDEAEEHLASARSLIPESELYDRACLESIAGNTQAAVELLQAAIRTDPYLLDVAKADVDFDFIRGDPGFQAVVESSPSDAGAPS